MCGIIGYVGKDNAKDIIISGLHALEYRGYDSSGIAYNAQNKIKIVKMEGKVSNLENKLKDTKDLPHTAIGHTRWATHGKPNEINAHPHKVGNTTLVHNGIIENYLSIKNKLKNIYNFKSETDTEVACALIDYYVKKEKNKLKALKLVQKDIIGSYAFAIIFDDEPENIYIMRKDSPLIVAEKDNNYYVASDIAAILSYTNKYYLLDQLDIAKISDKIYFFDSELNPITKKINEYSGTINDVMKNGFDHFMLKEIHDEVNVYKNIISNYVPNLSIHDLKKNFGNFSKYKKITIVGCGSAYHTGLAAKYLFENFANIETNVEMASEYRYKKIFPKRNELVILISQSGETADTLEAARLAKANKIDTLGIINVLSSSIARESDRVIYCLAGCEIAVATTKAYLAQLLILSLIAILMGYERKLITRNEANDYLLDLTKLQKDTKEIINNKDYYKEIAKDFYKDREMFFIGRNIDFALCMESSLKMKEISYIHSEAYAAGELKHGTISLIEEDMVVFGIVTNPSIAPKTISNLKETKARGSKMILVTTKEIANNYKDDKSYKFVITVNNLCPFFQSLTIITTMQLISYYVALLKGENIDQPRNLAKSVTVE
jgi:glucosamine--fructose-6-phosphate aminotransferase (isomerizing)